MTVAAVVAILFIGIAVYWFFGRGTDEEPPPAVVTDTLPEPPPPAPVELPDQGGAPLDVPGWAITRSRFHNGTLLVERAAWGGSGRCLGPDSCHAVCHANTLPRGLPRGK